MAIPDVALTIRDGALGLAGPNSNNLALKIGCAPLGVVNSILSVTDPTTLQAALGKGGPLTEAAALSLNVAGGPLLVVPANPSTYGTASAVTKIGTGTPSMTVAVKNGMSVIFKVTLGGAVATARLALSLDGGVTYQPDFLTAATVMVPGCSFLTVACGGATFTLGDTYTISTAGAVTQGGAGTGTVAVSAASAFDAFNAIITIVLGGALGTATFTYSLDGGQTVSGVLLVPASGTYVIPDSGLVLTFPAGTYVAGDLYTFTTTAPSYSTTDLANAMTAILADSRTWFMAHAVGAPSSVAGAATLLASLDSQLATAQNAYRFARGFIEVPSDTDANTIAAFVNASSLRVGACAGYVYTVSPLNGRMMLRNSAWHITARAAKNAPQVDVARVADGPLSAIPSSLPSGAKPLARDEQATPGLDAARFCTLRTIINRPGFYITNGRMCAPVGSDYTFLVNGRVMDIACGTARDASLAFLNDGIRTNADGTIYENDAKQVEAQIDNKLRVAITQPGYATDVSVVVNRANNLQSSQNLMETVRVTPFGYARAISLDIGFSNPALAAK